jgi:hypothetical protein
MKMLSHVLLTILLAVIPSSAAGPRLLTLVPQGDVRQLPNHIFGGSVEALIEHLLDDPAKIATLEQTAPAIMRFPGGSQSNYYDWQTGLLYFPVQANSSSYMKFWANAAVGIARAFPNGLKMEQYTPAARQIGAEVILVPNLETSTIADQFTWFSLLAYESILPTNIELGNEFWAAMAGDPAVMAKWPDEPTAMKVLEQYEAALRPIVGNGAKFAVQASGAAFNYAPDAQGSFVRRLLAWDKALAPAPWFEAVTAHLYPGPEKLAASEPNATTAQLFDIFMGRGDAGVDRVLDDITGRVPGKEIWITEWSPRGGNFNDLTNPDFHDLVPPPMRAQLVARYELAYLRHPAVTKALYFTLNFDPKSALQEYVLSADGKSYLPMDPALVLHWFNDAANGGSTFQRVIEPNGLSITGIGQFQESYRQIEGGLFTPVGRTVLILQNASAESRLYDPSESGTKPWPTEADLLVTPDLSAEAKVTAQTAFLPPDQPITLPPYSILRLIWNQTSLSH